MEILTSGFLKPSTTFPTMSCLSAILIQNQKFSAVPRKTYLVNLTYLNTDEHAHLGKRTGDTEILDMAFILPNLTKHDIQFLTADDLGSDHLPVEISIDAQPHKNIHTDPIRYKFNQADKEVFESTL